MQCPKEKFRSVSGQIWQWLGQNGVFLLQYLVILEQKWPNAVITIVSCEKITWREKERKQNMILTSWLVWAIIIK